MVSECAPYQEKRAERRRCDRARKFAKAERVAAIFYPGPDMSPHVVYSSAGVAALSAGIDEVAGAYKDIREVMREQADLVEIVAQFDPKIVKMEHGKE